MFSGIVEKTGIIKEFVADKLVIHEPSIAKELNLSDSVSVNGICLTIVDKNTNNFMVEISPETMQRTNLKDLNENDLLNLEKPLAYNDLIGGHLVQGHVDTVGKIENIKEDGNSKIFTISHPKTYNHYVVEKGFITIDGISLTVVKCIDNNFTLSIIPYTYRNTNLKLKKSGQNLNIEFDILAKYVEKSLSINKNN
ncbi:MAG: riboflavin synthase [Chloroflexi bacterium]|jgi:riboflavin synthase|nr:riboflavin synthase [Chloroflexota bacterium]|tara:strand:- start:2216 stop:2803 length:588 start_codon:yes stop_codon:yes gene_type:complete